MFNLKEIISSIADVGQKLFKRDKIKENDVLQVRIMGQRYELNDKQISIIAELISINNYNTLKNELSNDSELTIHENLDEKVDKIGGEKIKIKVKKSTANSIKNYKK